MNEQNIKNTKIYKISKSYLENEPDLYLILGDKIYPSHRRFLICSNYISKKMDSNDKVVIIEFKFNSQQFEKVLNFIYTSSICFGQGNKQLQNMLEITYLLQIDKLKQQILEQMDDHFEQYNIFCLYKIADKYNLKWLKDRCEEEFMTLEYEHFNINRYDLLQTSQKLFQNMIKDHQRLKANKTISGLKVQQIKSIIQEYNQHNKCNLNVQQLIKASHDCFQKQIISNKSLFDRKKTLSPPRKKQETIINNRISKSNSVDQEIHHFKTSSQKSKTLQNQLDQENEVQKEKQNKVHLMKQIRDQIFQFDQVQSPVVDFFDLQDKINQFSKISQCFQDRFLQNNNSYGQISERSCQQDEIEEDSATEEGLKSNENQNHISQKKTLSSPSQQNQYSYSPKIPVMYKNFMF